ncbi:tetratricopeptide repeat protein, partial [Aeromonas caviae]|uniref:tetratricopeptide repeat protein n=1 Tax=Aeromonas caviae TaxID=648 RepID=UPI001FBA1253
ASAQFNLGLIYAKGQGVPQDDKQAVIWLRKAAEQGNVEAQNNLAVLYAEGQGVPQDYKQAHAWFSVAAANG